MVTHRNKSFPKLLISLRFQDVEILGERNKKLVKFSLVANLFTKQTSNECQVFCRLLSIPFLCPLMRSLLRSSICNTNECVLSKTPQKQATMFSLILQGFFWRFSRPESIWKNTDVIESFLGEKCRTTKTRQQVHSQTHDQTL